MKRIAVGIMMFALLVGCQSKTETEKSAEAVPQNQTQKQPEMSLPAMRPSDAILSIDNITTAPGESGTFVLKYDGVEPAKAMVLPLRTPVGMHVDSVSWAGSMIDYLANKPVRIANDQNLLLIAAVPVTEPPVPPGKGVLATVYYTMTPDAKSGTIEETYAPPANQLSYVDTAKTLAHINFAGAKVTVQ